MDAVTKSVIHNANAIADARLAREAGKAIAEHCDERIAVIRAAVAKWTKPSHIRLHAGELTAQEMRSVLAVVGAIQREIETL